ncbi:hypothetical protein DMC30DRAFT_10755 [Rhodotorula diobovata]|uniref:Uncharacterized protein n=1 Tax=Rhodotorula diobovata TaxID=5288 RepID=A0A5C5G4Z5_9BASI|nr:hypothetical protein DMC30DRAFT_10755 [Rhodotorula diobovata]
MATADSTALLTLRGLACALGGITAGLLLAGPLLAVPSLFASPHLVPRSRLHVWSRLQADTATATSLLFPLLAALLACCALLVDSAAHTPTPSSQSDIEWLGWLVVRLVRENRKTLYTTAASLIIALRPFSFGLLTPRTEVLKAEERRLLLERLRSGSGSGSSLAAAGLSGWKGASPTKEYAGWVAEREREGEDSDVEDNDGDGGLGLGGGVDGVTPVGPLDSESHPSRCVFLLPTCTSSGKGVAVFDHAGLTAWTARSRRPHPRAHAPPVWHGRPRRVLLLPDSPRATVCLMDRARRTPCIPP